MLFIVLLSFSGIAYWVTKEKHSSVSLFEPQVGSIQSAPLCPWRDPAQDLRSFFPNATRYEAETHILSGMRLQLTGLLGRPPTGDENALHVYRIYQQQIPLGVVLAQRVKGAYGAIEMVLGVDPGGRICGIRLQRHREPDAIAAALQRAEWLGSFIGKQAGDPWKLGDDVPAVGNDARISAQAIVQGARSMLILLKAATDPSAGSLLAKPHH